MGKFMKNPRPYLLPPQPRPPVKLVVTGPPLSGKTSLSHLLAQKYGAKVSNLPFFSHFTYRLNLHNIIVILISHVIPGPEYG